MCPSWFFLIFVKVLQSGAPKADEAILYNMALVLDRVFVDVKVVLCRVDYSNSRYKFPLYLYSLYFIQAHMYSVKLLDCNIVNVAMLLFQDPFEFSPYHKAIREPFDYYKFGQNYIRQLLDFEWVSVISL